MCQTIRRRSALSASSLFVLLANGLVALLGLFLVAFGVAACARPAAAATFLAGFAGSAFKHCVELAVRIAFGWALVLASPNLSGSTWLAGAGWVLLVTSALMFLVPWKLHRSFARIAVPHAPFVLRGMGLASAFAGSLLLWALAA